MQVLAQEPPREPEQLALARAPVQEIREELLPGPGPGRAQVPESALVQAWQPEAAVERFQTPAGEGWAACHRGPVPQLRKPETRAATAG